MLSVKRIGLLALVLGSGLVLAGCQADNKPSQSTLMPGDKGVTCSKCQTTWVKVPNTGGKGLQALGYTSRKEHACPDCKSAVITYFETGKLEHSCKTCGTAMDICEAH